MLANRILNILVSVSSVVVVPTQLITTFLLGLLVAMSFGIILIPLSAIWMLFLFPMLVASRIASKYVWLRFFIGILGIPWAFAATIFIVLMPSMGEMESRAAKLMLCESWPYSWECWLFQHGRLNLYDSSNSCFAEVLSKISEGLPLMKHTIDKIMAGEELDSNL